jgi:acyl carrier protein
MTTIDKLHSIFRDVFQDETLVITPQTSALDIEAWDSLLHVSLVMEVESRFKVRFSTAEVAYLQTVGDLVALIDKKVPAN